MPVVAHLDDAPSRRRVFGSLVATWHDLGGAAGSVRIGVRRQVIDAGVRATPAHRHGREEEIFYVLAGGGLSWQDGETFEVRTGDALIHRAGAEAHTLVAGPAGLDVLAFGTREDDEAAHLPRIGVAWLNGTWTEVGGGEHPFAREDAAGELELAPPSARPQRIVNVDEAPEQEIARGRTRMWMRDLGVAGGSLKTGITHMRIAAGHEGWPPHFHSAEEELFIVLGGAGTLVLGDEKHPVRPGSLVSRPPATRVAHSFVAAQGADLVYLAYGTREPNDIAYFPRSGKVHLRGVGVIGRIEPLDYWDGEE